MHSYLRIVTTFQRVAHLAKIVSIQQHYEQFVGKHIRQVRKFLGISEAELKL